MLLLLFFFVAGIILITLTQAGPAQQNYANAWVDVDGGNCTYHTTPAPYASSEACSSFQQAVNLVTPGDTVRVSSGNYNASQSITAVKNSTTYVIGEPGVTVTGISQSGSNIEVQNIKSTGHSSLSGSNNTWRNVELVGTWAIIGGSDNSWIGGSLHDVNKVAGDPLDEPIDIFNASNALIDSVEFYNISFTPDPDVNKNPHLEMIRIDRGSTTTTIRNSYFHNNNENTSTIFFTQTPGTTAPSGLNIINNRFGSPGNGSTTLGLNSLVPCTKVLIAYNTFLGGTNGVSCSSPSEVRWIGNLGSHQMWNCVGVFSYNVWQDSATSKCGSTETVVAGARFGTDMLGLGGPDGFRLMAGSPAIDKAETPGASTICSPSTSSILSVVADTYGDSRPVGSRCDAGADEFGPSAPPPTGCSPAQNLGNINCDTKVDIFDLSIILSNYGKTTAQASNAAADLNNSGSIDGTDLSILLSNYGT